MELYLIKAKAMTESRDNATIIVWVQKVRRQIQKYPQGSDLSVPSDISDGIEEMCDLNGIPCCRVTDTTLSVAATYRYLWHHEVGGGKR
jgi:hypothetical protein